MLSQEQIDKIRGVLVLNGWREVMKPLGQARIETLRKIAEALPSERPDPYAKMDDHTANLLSRGEARGIEWFIHVFDNEVSINDFNRRRDELARQENSSDPEPANPV